MAIDYENFRSSFASDDSMTGRRGCRLKSVRAPASKKALEALRDDLEEWEEISAVGFDGVVGEEVILALRKMFRYSEMIEAWPFLRRRKRSTWRDLLARLYRLSRRLKAYLNGQGYLVLESGEIVETTVAHVAHEL